MLNKDTKARVYSPNGDTDNLDIIAGVLLSGTLVPFLFIICQDYVLRTSLDLTKKWDHSKNGKKRYLTETIMDADYTVFLAFLTSTPA